MTVQPDRSDAASSLDGGDRDYRRDPEFKRVLRVARKLAETSRWRQLLDTVEAYGLIADTPELLVERVRAAIELGDKQALSAFASKAAASGIDISSRLQIASSLVNANDATNAWKVLATVPRGSNDYKTTKIAQRIVVASADAEVRAEARKRLVSDHKVKSVTEERLEWEFPGPVRSGPMRRSPFRVVRVRGVNPALDHRAKEIMKGFSSKLGKAPLPYVAEYRDVFTNRVGQIWRKDGTILRGFGRAIEELKPASFSEVDTLFSCSREGRGYYEWLTDRLPSLAWRLGSGAPDCPILVNPEQMELARESLGLLGITNDKLLPATDAYFCRRLLIASTSQRSLVHRGKFESVFERLLQLAAESKGDALPSRFIISRRDTARRQMGNESALEAAAEENGIVPVVLSKLGLLEKIRLFQNAKLVVAAHGAGLSHLLFASPQLRVLELVPVAMNHFGHMVTRVCFAQLSQIRGLDHTMLLKPMNPATGVWQADIARTLTLAETAAVSP